jgi:signal transduction histidine kinase
MVQRAVAIAVVPMALITLLLADRSNHLEDRAVTGLYCCYSTVAPMLIGLYWWRRRPASRFGPLLIAFGIAAWMVTWQSSNWPLAFDLAVLAEAPLIVLTFALFLAFPSGSLGTVVDRALIGLLTLAALAFFVPWTLGSPMIAGGGPLMGCASDCPANVLQVGTTPDLVAFLGRWETYSALALAVAVLAVYLVRLRSASRPRRRALLAVSTSSLLFLPAFFVFYFSREVLELDQGTLDDMSSALVAAQILLPVGFLLALLQADLFAGVVRGSLIEQLTTSSTPAHWRDVVADALDDPALRLGYWDSASNGYREVGNSTLMVPPEDSDRAWVDVDRDGRPVAAMVIDGALAEDPELVRAAASATAIAVETGHLEGELRDSVARNLAAGDVERRRIERDLHDSAQQRLIALRIHLALTSEQIERKDQRLMVEQLGTEVEVALNELRSVAAGVYPSILADAGVATALRSIMHGSGAISTTIYDGWTRRHREAVEVAVYFSCLEALQNATKHAGADAAATVRLTERDGQVGFEVEDDGIGFDPATVRRGAGLQNITDRVTTAGGSVRFESSRTGGSRVSASLPA